jgi:soluble lytic murein transglycosylase-like protein
MIPIPTILLSALIMVESSGNDRAIGRMGELGPLQIMPTTLVDINRISGRSFTRSDAFHRESAIQMATIYLNHYATEKRLGRKPTFRDYAMIWHHGPNGWKRTGPDRYWNKVQRHLR